MSYNFADHLGSTSVSVNAATSTPTGELRYGAWGDTRIDSGSTPTNARYTGQYEAMGGLYYYNARWYDSSLGRFLSADSIIPEPGNPLDWDRYAYARNNAIRYSDPTGHITQGEEKDADKIIKKLANYNVSISIDWGIKNKKWQDGLWTLDELQMILDSVQALASVMGGSDKFKSNLGGVMITQKQMKEKGLGDAHKVTLSATDFDNWTVVHELVHAWDAETGWKLSSGMSSGLGAGFKHPILHSLFPNNPAYWYDPGQGPPPCGIDANFNVKEDFAEAVTAYTYPSEASSRAKNRNWPYKDTTRGYSYSSFISTPRGQHIKDLMVHNP